jgi:hypothetical protein
MPSASGGAGGIGTWLRLSMNTVQAVLDNTLTKMSFDTVSHSQGWEPLPVAPVTNVSMPYSGLVLMIVDDADFGESGDGAGKRILFTRKNDVVASQRALQSIAPTLAAATSATATGGSRVFGVTAGDTLQLYIIHSAGESRNIAVVSAFFIYLAFGSFTFSGVN